MLLMEQLERRVDEEGSARATARCWEFYQVSPEPPARDFQLRRFGYGDTVAGITHMTLAPNRRNEMDLRVIPTGVHSVLDYMASATNLVFPGLLGLHDAPWAVLVPRIDGVAGAGYSLITDYELGAFKVLPMPTHLAFDAAKGAFMASSPWLFGFARNGTRYWLPHVLMGVADVLAAITTKTD